MQSYPNPQARAYVIKFIPFTAPNAYHVINVETKISHSMHTDPITARQVARDLNLAIKRERAVFKAATQRHLRLVK